MSEVEMMKKSNMCIAFKRNAWALPINNQHQDYAGHFEFTDKNRGESWR